MPSMVESIIAMAAHLSPRQDDDWADRLHYLLTPNLLLAAAVLISFKQFGGRPIECMFPNKFPSSWEQYAENYCWAQDTYFVESDKHVELIKENERYAPDRQLSYYQWVPFFLLLQAAFFRGPSLVWKYFSNHSGIRIHEVVEKAQDTTNVDEEVREKNVNTLVRHLKCALRFQRRMDKRKIQVHKTLRCLNYQYSSGFMSSMYLFTKLLYLANVGMQLFLMNYFLGTTRHQWYGLGVIADIIQGVQWETSGYFPRVSVCDFTVRQVANIQKYSVQCVLVINIFNEKIFILLWFWYSLLAVCSIFSTVYWLIVLSFPCFSHSFVSQHMELSNIQFNPEKDYSQARDVRRFVHNYLHRDGVFVLRMVSAHAGVIFATELVQSLWEAFYGLEHKVADESVDTAVDCALSPPPLGYDSSVRKRQRQIQSFHENGEFETTLLPESPSHSSKEDVQSER